MGVMSKSTASHMKYRVARAHALLTEKTDLKRSSNSFMDIVKEESSDEEGGFPMAKPRTFVRRK